MVRHSTSVLARPIAHRNDLPVGLSLRSCHASPDSQYASRWSAQVGLLALCTQELHEHLRRVRLESDESTTVQV
jgi:hypothetical protein